MPSFKRANLKHAIARTLLVAVIVIIIIILVGGTYAALSLRGSTTTTSFQTTTTTSTSLTGSSTTSSTTSTSQSVSGPQNATELIEYSDQTSFSSFDVATGFATQDQEILINTYQGLLMFNYTSSAQFVPMLAANWTIYPNDTAFMFGLRDNAWFANGNQFNSSVVWWNTYRTILMNQFGATFYTNTLYNGTTAFSTGYVIPYGATAALEANGYSFSNTNATLQAQQVAGVLSGILSNFQPSNATIQRIMSYPNQAVQVVSNDQVEFHLINPYSKFLDVEASPGTLITDPGFVDQNGGVQPNAQSSYMNAHAMSTGPYEILRAIPSQYVIFQANPNYWAAKLPASQSNIMLTPPHIPVVITQYFTNGVSQIIQGFESNQANIIQGPQLPSINVPPSNLPSLQTMAGINVSSYPNAPKFAYLMAGIDTLKAPTNITDFRLALNHAVNISQIISTVVSGYGEQYVGPIAPGLPYYNPTNLPTYAFNPNLSIQLLVSAGFKLNLANGTTINPSGVAVPTITLGYTTGDESQLKLVQEMQIMFQNVGVPTMLDPLTASGEVPILSQSGTAANYPNLFIWYWYPGWLDPVAQELVVLDNSAYGGFAGNVAWLSNATINSLTNTLPFLTNQSLYNSTVSQVYNMVYQQSPYIWLYSTVEYSVAWNYVGGVFYNSGLTGYYFPLMYYKT